MNWLFKAAATLAAVFVIAAVGYAVLPGLAILGPGASPSSNATLIARGTFQTQRDWGAVELIATGEGANATGQMTVSREGWSLSVEFDCARTTEDGLILIGGHVTDHSNAEANVDSWPDGTLAGIALKPGSPTQAQIWVGSLVNWPATQATDCSAYVDAWLGWYRTFPDQDIWLDPIEGTVEFGP